MKGKTNTIKILSLLLLCTVPLGGCSEREAAKEPVKETIKEPVKQAVSPDINNIKQICSMATLKCYYHNVAKSTKTAGTGLLHIGEKERKFWIDYTGVAEISYDISRIRMEQDGKNIIITLPPPDVECTVDPGSWDESSYIISKDSFFKSNPITAADQNQAIQDAQNTMRASVLSNSSILTSAETQAKKLIKNYIDKVGENAKVKYEITWQTEADKEDKE